jgi:hypothetical protein
MSYFAHGYALAVEQIFRPLRGMTLSWMPQERSKSIPQFNVARHVSPAREQWHGCRDISA